MSEIILIMLAVWLLAVIIVLLRNRALLFCLWSEPVLRRPVMIIESDDWGAGPPEQVQALQKLAAILSGHADCDGRHPVMTLGLVLACVDTRVINANGLDKYQRRELGDPAYLPLKRVIMDGVRKNVFSIQLHGMEHYWPPALMQAARNDEAVRYWLSGEEFPATEQLPAHLQSRWINTATLPATPLSVEQISIAAGEEVSLFRELFDGADLVIVPPTFVWNDIVERAWAENGIRVLVTPGSQFESRDDKGKPTAARRHYFNGQVGDSNLIYIVRNDYFEPLLGHTAETGLAALQTKTECGRPSLLETHRYNFINADDKGIMAFNELSRLLKSAVRTFPDIAFISTAQLARIYRQRDPVWLADNLMIRIHTFIRRCRVEYRIWRGFRMTGLTILLSLLDRLLPVEQSRIDCVSHGSS